ncbi:MAG: hypothetical protein PW790_06990 [Parvibaculaceae bacterium]|nr:hypothetical protein [Parvibaculaceae bacterium]
MKIIYFQYVVNSGMIPVRIGAPECRSPVCTAVSGQGMALSQEGMPISGKRRIRPVSLSSGTP